MKEKVDFIRNQEKQIFSILKRRDLSHVLSHVDSQIKSTSEDDNIFFSHLHRCRISLHLPSLLCTTDHQGRNEPCLRWFDIDDRTTWNWTRFKDPGAATSLNFVDHVVHVVHSVGAVVARVTHRWTHIHLDFNYCYHSQKLCFEGNSCSTHTYSSE